MEDYFDDDFELEEDEELDDFILKLGQIILEDEYQPHEDVPERIELIKKCGEGLKYAIAGKNVKFTCGLHNPFPSCGYISIVGEDVVVVNPDLFAAICSASDNFNIYSRTDGKIQMDFGFHGLTRKLVEVYEETV
ncbi:MAG: hypothetical protein LUH02_11955 [Erysipelotrichaceae bacterium]|nr:hypothetical protein [Erysipelotrichaceae bacterium]